MLTIRKNPPDAPKGNLDVRHTETLKTGALHIANPMRCREILATTAAQLAAP